MEQLEEAEVTQTESKENIKYHIVPANSKVLYGPNTGE